MKSFYLVLCLLISYAISGFCQSTIDIEPITCYLNDYTEDAYQAPPPAFLEGNLLAQSDIQLIFGDSVPAVARAAMEYAASIWESRLASNVPIQVEVSWESFEEDNVLASAGPRGLYRDFPGALSPDVWYPTALAEAIIGENINGNNPEIGVRANRDANWYYGIDGAVPPGQIDMVSVILHELGHGLGFLSSADVTEDETEGKLGFSGFPIVYDVFLETLGAELTDTTVFPNPSELLLDAFTSNALVFADEMAADLNEGLFPLLFAPSEFDRGSSVSHLDEFFFPSGSENALMTPRLAFREAVHDPGPVGLAIMQAMGWETTFIMVNTQDASVRPMELFPNPSSDVMQVQWPFAGEQTTYRIYNIQGRMVQHGILRRGEALSVAALPPALYQLLLQSDGQFFGGKIMVK